MVTSPCSPFLARTGLSTGTTRYDDVVSASVSTEGSEVHGAEKGPDLQDP